MIYANMVIIYWLGRGWGKGGGSLFKLEYMIIWCKIHVIKNSRTYKYLITQLNINPYLQKTRHLGKLGYTA